MSDDIRWIYDNMGPEFLRDTDKRAYENSRADRIRARACDLCGTRQQLVRVPGAKAYCKICLPRHEKGDDRPVFTLWEDVLSRHKDHPLSYEEATVILRNALASPTSLPLQEQKT